jgi:hypothetical protein
MITEHGLKRVGLKSIREAVRCSSKVWVLSRRVECEEATLIQNVVGPARIERKLIWDPWNLGGIRCAGLNCQKKGR